MCGIVGAIHLRSAPVPDLARRLAVMSELVAHRGPDDDGLWVHPRGHVGLAHRRLSIIDVASGQQPMTGADGSCLTFNGEIYNYPELRQEIGGEFRTASDTEVLLRAHERWGVEGVQRLRGMFAYAIWDEPGDELVCVRDRFGIKPLYYATVGDILYFASEIKALLPFLPRIETDLEGLKDYLVFQLCLGGKTLFKGVSELPAGHQLRVRNGKVEVERYWEIYYELDWGHREQWFVDRVGELLEESVHLHLRSDVPVAAYLSGGLDSSAVASLARTHTDQDEMHAFIGRFAEGRRYDESRYARAVAETRDLELHELEITSDDFIESIGKVVYHMDQPAAGPGSFPQYMVSKLASQHVKVILGGQGGDEIFGGYTRYLIAYFEQCIKAAIDGTTKDGNFVVTYESIIPNLIALEPYKPLLKEFWREGLFENLDARYFRLIDRAPSLGAEIDWSVLGDYSPFETFQAVFNGSNVGHEAYFDKMTHFDFKTLLPALLQVEDRVSMAHGLESRVPLLDHRLVELAATVPADVKFKNGEMKHLFKQAARPLVPDVVAERKDKMGFPVPLTDWINGDAGDFVRDVLSTDAARSRGFVDNAKVVDEIGSETPYGRKIWGLLNLELWQQTFHDRESEFRRMLDRPTAGAGVDA